MRSDLAQSMGMSPSLLSQILKGDKQLSMEQADEGARRMGLMEAETDFWFLLVEKDRAGTHALRSRLERKIRLAREAARQLSKRSLKDTELSEETKGVFYSNWIYTAVPTFVALPGKHDVSTLARDSGLPLDVVAQVVQFLIENNLLVQKDGRLTYGSAHTYVGQDSPHVIKHHRNWRLKGFSAMEFRRESDLFFTAPFSLSKELVDEIRGQILPDVIQQIYKKVGPSPSEQVACLNIDWFDFTANDAG